MSHPTPASPNSAAAPDGPPADQTDRLPDQVCALGQFPSARPVLVTESLTDYEYLLASVFSVLRPCDVIAEIAAKDFADLTWEIERLKRLKARQLTEGVRTQLISTLKGLQSLGNRHVIDHAGARSRAIACLNGDAAVRDEVSAFQQAAVDWDTITAWAIAASGAQDSKASNDAVATGVGVVLFWPALFFHQGRGRVGGRGCVGRGSRTAERRDGSDRARLDSKTLQYRVRSDTCSLREPA